MKRLIYFNDQYLDHDVILKIVISYESFYHIKIELFDNKFLIEFFQTKKDLDIRVKKIYSELEDKEMLRQEENKQEQPKHKKSYTFFNRIVSSPEIRRKGPKNIFEEAQEEYERQQVEGKGYHSDDEESLTFKMN